jgi:hypothetical protein
MSVGRGKTEEKEVTSRKSQVYAVSSKWQEGRRVRSVE